MTIYTDLPIRRGPFYLEDYQSSLGASLDATAEDYAVTNPITSIMRRRELSRAERGVGPNVLDYNPFGDQPPSTASDMLDAGTARQRIKDAGLSLTVPDEGIRERALDIIMERKRSERQRNDILNRAPGGVVAGAARLGTSLAVSAMDPLNIASAFIPVIGEARYAAMLGRAGSAFGRAGVRAGVGAVEGAVGAAVVEPIVYSAATQEQADYGFADSVMNIALGTALGGGLHLGAGAIADAVRAGRDWRTAKAESPIGRAMESAPPSVREDALRTGVAQVMSGREIDVEPVVSYAMRQGFEQPLRASVGPAEMPRLDAVTSVEGFTVFHGSPHTFDRFSMEHIGAGEGAQAYGHGLYFAQEKGIAEGYQARISSNLTFLRNGEQIPSGKAHEELTAAAQAIPGTHPDQARMIARNILDFIEEDKSSGARVAEDYQAPGGFERQWEAAIKAAKDLAYNDNPGATYEVRIRANPDDFLDWDDPRKWQSAVRDAFVGRGINPDDRFWHNSLMNSFMSKPEGGSGSYKDLGRAAAEFLKSLGIPGIKYLDAGSRGAGDGSRNFVVFDDSLLHTIRRNDEFIAQQPQDIRAKAFASFAPEQMRLYDGETVRIADERIAATPADDAMPEVTMQEALEDVQRLADALGDSEIVAREMADVDALVQDADALGRGITAAADCRIRRG